MPSITDLAYTNNIDNNKRPLKTDLDTAFTSVQTFSNDSLKDNLVQLALDAYGTPYAFDSDGAAQYTNNLYDKRTAVDSDAAGSHLITTTGAWTDLDATNSSISITPELAGDFKVTCQFCVEFTSTNATNEADVAWRLTDGSETSTAIGRTRMISGVSASLVIFPVTLMHQFDSWSAAAKTVKLQYFITTRTAMTINIYATSSQPIAFQVEKI